MTSDLSPVDRLNAIKAQQRAGAGPADVGWLLEHIEQLQRQRQGLLDICAAAEAAELKPGVKDSLRIEVPWTRVVRMALGVDRD